MDVSYFTALCTALSALLLAVLGWVTTRIKLKTTNERLASLTKSDLTGLYVICPNCGAKVYLGSSQIYKEVKIENEEK